MDDPFKYVNTGSSSAGRCDVYGQYVNNFYGANSIPRHLCTESKSLSAESLHVSNSLSSTDADDVTDYVEKEVSFRLLHAS